jgi:hypothetical protein
LATVYNCSAGTDERVYRPTNTVAEFCNTIPVNKINLKAGDEKKFPEFDMIIGVVVVVVGGGGE